VIFLQAVNKNLFEVAGSSCEKEAAVAKKKQKPPATSNKSKDAAVAKKKQKPTATSNKSVASEQREMAAQKVLRLQMTWHLRVHVDCAWFFDALLIRSRGVAVMIDYDLL